MSSSQQLGLRTSQKCPVILDTFGDRSPSRNVLERSRGFLSTAPNYFNFSCVFCSTWHMIDDEDPYLIVEKFKKIFSVEVFFVEILDNYQNSLKRPFNFLSRSVVPLMLHKSKFNCSESSVDTSVSFLRK